MLKIKNITDKKDLLDCVLLAELLCIRDEKERLGGIRQVLEKAEELGVKKELKEMLYALRSSPQNENTADNIADRFCLEEDKKGEVKKTIENFLNIFGFDEKFVSVRYNELSNRGEFEGKAITDSVRSRLIYHIEKNYRLKNEKDFDHALSIYLLDNRYHPVREKIKGLVWDKKPRIERFLHKVMGAQDSDYTRECSRLIFHCGIARIFNPGCKVDDVIVLQGEQGNGKSTIVSWLAMQDDWYGRVNEIRGNTGIEQIQGKWICEISELLAVTGKEKQEEAKQYLDRKSDNYRRPYAQFSEELPRQCIFIGTTNLRQPFSDKTGNRRYYPVWCNIKPGELYDREKPVKHYIEQCWAEAYYLWHRGEICHSIRREMLETVRAMQKNAIEDDWRVGKIESFLETKTETCILEIWTEALGMPDKPNQRQSRELGVILDNIDGWERGEGTKHFKQFKAQRFWHRKITADLIPIDENYSEIIDKF